MVTFIVPPFVNHDEGAIYSIHSHPSGEKFLTCGQREQSSSGVIMVWNMGPTLSEKLYKDKSVPKLLCQINTQSGANCTRWSPDGKRFAVGFDDYSVIVYEYLGRVNSAGSVMGKAANVERYKEVANLRMHSMEVLSVEWSQNGKYLASASMDHKVIIWNAKKLPDRVTTLKDHEGPVKGISWDPIGKYLATISADKTLKIWQTDNWQCVESITKPFENSGNTTMFSRMDWSPDGKYLFAPTSTNNTAPTVQLIERQTWNTERDLVGHRKATTCVRVLPKILCTELKNGKKMQLSCVAIGSRDKGVSIWLLPGINRPLLVHNRMFLHSVMDMNWCGMNLLICSQDGTMAVLQFDDKTLGEAFTDSAMSDLCYKMYCIRPPQYEDESSTIDEDTNGFGNNDSINSSFMTCPEDVLAKRKKTVEESKKDTQETSEAMEVDSEAEVTRKETEKTKEKQLQEERSQQVEEVKNGKRRIQPIFLASTSTDEVPTMVMTKKPPAKKIVEEDEEMEEETSSEEDEEDDEEEEYSTDEEDSVRRRRSDDGPRTGDGMLAADFKKPNLRGSELPSMKVTPGTVVMDAPEQLQTLTLNIGDLQKKGFAVEIDNKWKHAGIETSSVRMMKKKTGVASSKEAQDGDDGENRKNTGEVLWMVVVGAPVLLVAANKHLVILGCADRCLRVYKTFCGSLVTSPKLDSLPVTIGVREQAVYVLTEYGMLSTWELKSQKVVIPRQAVFECIEASKDNNISLATLDVSENGIPLMVLSNGSIFTYNQGLQCWIQIMTMSVVSKLTAPLLESQLSSDGPLCRVLKRMRKQATIPNIGVNVTKAVKESQLEQLVNCAELLGNSTDYQTMLTLYAEAISQHGSEKKMKNLISELSRSVPIMLVGIRRAALLDDVTKIFQTSQPAIMTRITSGVGSKKGALF